MRILILFISSMFLFSCTENDAKLDVETNTYYAKYLYIYNNHDSLGVEKSIALLDEYIEEFPNALNGHLFKAWLLAHENKFNEVNIVLTKALEYDSTNTRLYAYWSSLLLMDTNSLQKAESINNKGLKLSNEDLELHHNKTWIYLFNEKDSLALDNALNICKLDTLNTYLFKKTALISSAQNQKESLFNSLLKDMKLKKEDSLSISLYRNNEIDIIELYKPL